MVGSKFAWLKKSKKGIKKGSTPTIDSIEPDNENADLPAHLVYNSGQKNNISEKEHFGVIKENASVSHSSLVSSCFGKVKKRKSRKNKGQKIEGPAAKKVRFQCFEEALADSTLNKSMEVRFSASKGRRRLSLDSPEAFYVEAAAHKALSDSGGKVIPTATASASMEPITIADFDSNDEDTGHESSDDIILDAILTADGKTHNVSRPPKIAKTESKSKIPLVKMRKSRSTSRSVDVAESKTADSCHGSTDVSENWLVFFQ